ncbi:MAG TPA: HAMP domain-containing sensor histidine kinase [Bacteroidales bacterium]|nr:HAMP domain-containing sensor histidine kinase [Bacteroidales bacterium]
MIERLNSLIFSCTCFIVLLFVSACVHSQSKSRADQLYEELITHGDKLKDDTATVWKYYEYAILCSEKEGAWDAYKEPNVCIFGFQMSERIGYKKGIKEFINVSKKCFRQTEGLPEIIVHTYPDAVCRDTLRLLYQARKQLHGGSVDWYRNAFKTYKEMRMFREAGMVRFWNALAFYDSDNFREALQLFEQAGVYFYLANDHPYLLKLALFKGCTYYFLKNYNAALQEFNRAKNESCLLADSSSSVLTLYNRGEVLSAMKDPKQALSDFSEAFNLERMHGDTCRDISGRIKVARAYYSLKQFKACIQELTTALEEAKMKGDKNGKAEALYLLSNALMQSGDNGSAAGYLQEFVSLRDFLFTAELSGFMKAREYFWINKLGRQITYQAHIDHERNAYYIQLRKNKFFLWGILILALLLSLIGILLFRSNQINKKANEYLRELDQTRNLFFSIIAHDLRGPLFATDLLLKPAIQKAEQTGHEELTAALKEISLQNSRRRLLLDNLLSWASIQRGTIKCKLQKVNITDIIDKAIHLYSSAAKQAGSTIKQGIIETEYILADPDMMELIIRNLIDNALKHGGANIEVSVDACTEGANMRISIADNGPGIDQEVIERFMIENSMKDIGSNKRLGLSLIRFFIELQAGKIQIERLKKGTRISFTMPLYKD